ncbi:Protein CBG05012 [Caenorhabditis briggsae]|uniref:Protein CBG05012 n=1 Tax=Caenorhabditis briggsae TaxID=6238 RepID=A8WYZ4_CAEBR|nr:Protein CBG05012 [Caenorhabditis briggsae]CAP25603.2 Protein CBG05012 [Caenorhabditis briggsae]
MGDLDATNPVEVKTNNEGGIQFSKFDRCFWYLSYAFEFTTGIIFFAFLCIVSPSSCQLMKYQFTLALIDCFLQILTVNTIYKGPQSMRIIISIIQMLWKIYCFVTFPIFMTIVSMPLEYCNGITNMCFPSFTDGVSLTKIFAGLLSQGFFSIHLFVEYVRFYILIKSDSEFKGKDKIQPIGQIEATYQVYQTFFGYDDLPLLGTYMLESIITMFVVIIVGDFIPPNYEFMQNQMVIMLMLSLLNNCNVIKIVAKKFRWITVSFMYFHIIWKFYCFLTIPFFLVIVTDPRENCSEEIHGCVELFGGDAFLTKMLVGMTAQLVLGGNLLVEIKRFSLSTFKPEKREISNIVSLCTPQRATQIV